LLLGFWIRETGTVQQVAQLHDRYMMMMFLGYKRVHYVIVLNTVSNCNTMVSIIIL